MKRFLSLLISMLTIYGLTVRFDGSYESAPDPRSFFLLPLFILILLALNAVFDSSDKRLKLTAGIPAAVLGLCHLLGGLLIDKNSVLWILKNSQTVLCAVLIFFSSTVLLFCFFFFCFRFLSTVRPSADTDRFSRISFPILWALTAVLWLPWLLALSPGVMTADTTDQIKMALGLEPLTNHHPVLYTILLRAALSLGELISGAETGYQTGIFFFTVLQFLGMTVIYAAVLRLILQTAASKELKIGAFLLFLLYPVHPRYSVTIWKDVPFAVCILIMTAFLSCELREHRIRNCIGIAVSGLLLSLFRHNGIYLIILTIPFLFPAFKGRRKPVILAFAAVILLFIGWRQYLKVRQIPDGRASEAFSIPLQLTALTAKRQHNTMDKELAEELDSWFTVEEVWTRYIYRISDPVKNTFDEEKYSSAPGKFWKFWLRLGMTYPQDYLDGILLHTFGYWYPETPHWVFITGIDDNGLFGIHTDPKLNTNWMNAVIRWFSDLEYEKIPLLSLCFSPGACFWLFLAAFFYCLYRRSNAFILFIPLFILWLTALASPVNCEYRYVYAMFACFPLILSALPIGEKSE